MQDQNNTSIQEVSPSQNMQVEDKPQMPNSRDSLWKFVLLFMLGCSIFALFLAFAGKTPFSLYAKKSSNTPYQGGVNMTDVYKEEYLKNSQNLKENDQKMEETDVTSEVINDINDLGSSNEDADYSADQLDELK